MWSGSNSEQWGMNPMSYMSMPNEQGTCSKGPASQQNEGFIVFLGLSRDYFTMFMFSGLGKLGPTMDQDEGGKSPNRQGRRRRSSYGNHERRRSWPARGLDGLT